MRYRHGGTIVGSVALGVVLVGAGCSGARGDDVSVRGGALSTPLPFALSFPAGVNPLAATVAASDGVELGDRNVIGTAYNAGSAELGLGITGSATSLVSVGPVALRDRSTVQGLAESGATVSLINGAKAGQVINHATLTPLQTLSWSVLPPTLVGNVDLEPGKTGTIAPNSYGSVAVKSGATLHLSPGTYFIQSLDLEPGAILTLDQTAPVVVYVTSGLTFRGTINDGGNATRFFLGYSATTSLTIESQFRGALVAPLAAINISSTAGQVQTGFFYGKSVSAQPDTHFTAATFAGWGSIVPIVTGITASSTPGPCDTVTLQATAVTPPGVAVDFDWAVVSAPAGARFQILSNTVPFVSFSSEDPGTYVISVTATASSGPIATATITIQVVGTGSCAGTTTVTSRTGSSPVLPGPGNLPPFTPTGDSGDEGNEGAGINVPTGIIQGPLAPSVTASGTKTPGVDLAGAADPVIFQTNNPYAANAATVPDISGASASSNVVFATDNFVGRFSSDGGSTFTTEDPTTIFPSAPTKDSMGNLLDNGFCCDQIVQYAPSIDRVIWLMQFCGSGAVLPGGNCLQGVNRLRIAWARPSDMISNFSNAWTYMDFTSAQVAGGGAMDYPDMAIGNQNLYVSADKVGTGLLVIRVPLAQMQTIPASGNISFNFTNPSDSSTAYGGHLAQNSGSQMFWAGHIDNSNLRVFSWPESSGSYSWRTVGVNTWPNCNYQALTSDGTTDWLFFQFSTNNNNSPFPTNAVLGATVVPPIEGSTTTTDVWFGWVAGRGILSNGTCGPNKFPQSHIQLARIDTSTFQLKEQDQIWNSNYAFSYPAFTTNSNGDLGMSLLWGGNSQFDATHAVGIWGDFEVWNSGSSQGSFSRNGDFLAVRPHAPDTRLFAGFGYNLVNNTPPATGLRVDPRYVVFGRQSIISPGGGGNPPPK